VRERDRSRERERDLELKEGGFSGDFDFDFDLELGISLRGARGGEGLRGTPIAARARRTAGQSTLLSVSIMKST